MLAVPLRRAAWEGKFTAEKVFSGDFLQPFWTYSKRFSGWFVIRFRDAIFMGKMKIHYPQWKTRYGTASDGRHADRDRLANAIALTAEACGQPLSAPAAEMLADDLARFDEAAILSALARCRLELDGPLRIAEIVARIDDGRPDADEAWSLMPNDEYDSVVWTEEMARAWGVAQPLRDAGDLAAARSAFRKTYEKSVLEARIRNIAPRWTPSLGLDVDGRELALREAVTKGRTTAAQVEPLLGYPLDAAVDEGDLAQVGIKSLH
jgi:hypothetical protein